MTPLAGRLKSERKSKGGKADMTLFDRVSLCAFQIRDAKEESSPWKCMWGLERDYESIQYSFHRL